MKRSRSVSRFRWSSRAWPSVLRHQFIESLTDNQNFSGPECRYQLPGPVRSTAGLVDHGAGIRQDKSASLWRRH